MDDDQSPVILPDDAESVDMYQDDNVDNVDLYEDLDLFSSTRSVTECSLSYTEVGDIILKQSVKHRILYCTAARQIKGERNTAHCIKIRGM